MARDHVKSLVIIAAQEYDHSSRSSVSMVAGADSIHIARGPWSAQMRDVVTIVTYAPDLDTVMRSLEVASSNGARFYLIAKPVGPGSIFYGHIEAWSRGDGQVYGVGSDCDEQLPSCLASSRDEARAIAFTAKLANAFADMATALSKGLGVATLVHAGGGA
jgi:hypothetical protein